MRAIIVVVAVALLTLAGCEDMTDKPEPTPTPATPEPPPPACPAHSATRIVGDWDSIHAVHDRDDESYSFHVDGTYQHTWSTSSPEPGLAGAIITRTTTGSGSYSYVAATCTLTWSPETANLDNFVAWDGPDQFCTKFNSRSSCLAAFNRKTLNRDLYKIVPVGT